MTTREGSEKTILLVEDNPDDRELTRRALESNGNANPIVMARDGVEALDYIFCRGARADRDPTVHPEVVLLDLKLPSVDGIEVLRAIRSDPRTALLPVIVLTSSQEDRDRLESCGSGANSP